MRKTLIEASPATFEKPQPELKSQVSKIKINHQNNKKHGGMTTPVPKKDCVALICQHRVIIDLTGHV